MRQLKLPLFAALLSLVLLLCGCGNNGPYDFETTFPSGNTAELHLEFSTSPPTAPTPVPSQVPAPISTVYPTQVPGSASGNGTPDTTTQPMPVQTPAPTAAPTVRPSPSPSAAPTPSPTVFYPNEVTITKSPTSETVYAGGSALFIARANNATSINWILVSPDAKTSYRIQDIPQHFEGVTVDGQGTEKLRLSNIPASMSGWRIQCYFTGENGPKYSSGAYLTVLSSTPAPISSSSPSMITDADAAVQTAVETATVSAAQQIYQTASGYGYTVSDIANYSYSSNMATFSMNFYFGTRTCTANFRTLYNAGTYPTTVYYTNNGQTRSEDLSGQGLDIFYSRLAYFKSA